MIQQIRISALIAACAIVFSPLATATNTLVLNFAGGAGGTAALSDAANDEMDKFVGEIGVDPRKSFLPGCFELPMVDPSTGVSVGLGIDCLDVVEGTPPGALGVEAYTFFILPGGTFVTHGFTSASPFTPTYGDGDELFSHVTGSIPGPVGGDSIVAGDRAFADVTGTARISGAVDLLGLHGSPDDIYFDCLFVVDLERSRRPAWAPQAGNGRAP